MVPDSPYVGLEPFDLSHAPFFFGRTLDADIIVDNVLSRPITILHGASGVGKSSLLNVGVPRALERRDGLASIVLRREWLTHAGVYEWLQEVSEKKKSGLTILVLDQFEDLFLYSREQSVAETARALASLLADSKSGIHILISIREDALYLLDSLRAHLTGLFDTTLELRHLTKHGVREAILAPLKIWNEMVPGQAVTADDRFADTLIAQLDQESGRAGDTEPRLELAYLQLALQSVWKAEMEMKSSVIRAETLVTRLGGVRKIAQRHVDAVLKQLPEPDQAICAAVFDRLVTRSGQRLAFATADLAPIVNQSSEVIDKVLEPLTKQPNRILRAVQDVANSGPGFEVLHAILVKPIYAWTQTRAEEERAKTLAGKRIKEEQERSKERELTAAKQHAAEIQRASKRLSFALIGLALAAFLLCIAVWQAVRNYKLALTRQVAARSVEEMYLGNVDRSLLLGVAAWRLSDTQESRSALLRVIENTKGLLGFFSMPTEGIASVAFSPDGHVVATGGTAGTVALRDIWTEREIARFKSAHDNAEIVTLTFSQDGRQLTAVTSTSRILTWSGPDKSVSDVQETTNLSIGAGLSNIIRWTATTLQILPHGNSGIGEDKVEVATMVGQDGSNLAVEYVAASPDGTTLAACLAGPETFARIGPRKILVWDIPGRKSIAVLETTGPPISSVQFVPGSPELVFASRFADANAEIWDFKVNKTWPIPDLHGVGSIAVSADGHRLAIGSIEGLAIWALPGRTKVWQPLQKSLAAPRSVTFSSDGQLVAATISNERAVLWQLSKSDPLQEFRWNVGHKVSSSSVDSKEERIAVVGLDGRVEVRNTNGTSIRRIDGVSGTGTIATYSGDGSLLAFGGSSGKVAIVRDGGNVSRIDAKSAITALTFSPNAPLLAWATVAGNATIFDLAHQSERPLSDGHTPMWSMAFSKDGEWLAGGGTDGNVKVWEASTGRLVAQHSSRGDALINSVAFSPDGTMVSIGSDGSNSISLWSVSSGLSKELYGLSQPATAVAFNPKGTVLASGSADGQITLWDPTERIPLAEPLGALGDRVVAVVFDEDGKQLMSTSSDGEVIVWNTGEEDWARRACKLANRELTPSEWDTYIRPNPVLARLVGLRDYGPICKDDSTRVAPVSKNAFHRLHDGGLGARVGLVSRVW